MDPLHTHLGDSRQQISRREHYLFPTPAVTAAFFRDKATFDLFLLSTKLSATLLYTGYALGAISGTLTGLIIGWSRYVESISVPIVKVVAPIPATAWIPIAIVSFPTLQQASIFILWIAAFFPTLFNSYGGVKGLSRSHVEIARVLGASDFTIMRRVVIPFAMPSIFIGLYFGLILDLISLIPAEMIGVQAGIGWYMSYARSWSQYDLVFANMFEIGLLSLATISLMDRIRDRILRWQRGVVR